MKKIIGLVAILLFVGFISLLPQHHTSADSFNQNRIIDNAVFDNSNAMTAAQIDAFLNTFPNSCISPNSGFTAIDPTGYSPSSSYTFGGFVSAGQVIFDAAQAYDINPQVLLTTLQKEQSLVVGGTNFCNNGDQNKYTAAVGYGCPDSGTSYSYSNVNLYARNGVMVTNSGTTCVNTAAKAGFSQQIIRGAWLLKFGEQRSQGNIGWAVIKGAWNNSDDPQTCYGGPMTQGTFQICPSGSTTYYDGYTTIDSTAVHMDDGATAALYWYTPHFSGNQHFFTIFSNWFGSTTYKQPVSSMFVVGNQSDKLYFISLNNNTRYYIPSWSTAQAYGLDRYQVMPLDDALINNYSDGGTLKTLVWNNNDQKIYLVDNSTKHWFQQYCTQWGLDCLNSTQGDVSFISSTYFDTVLNNGGTSQPLLQSNGTIYRMQNGTKQPIANTPSLLALGYTGGQILSIQQSDLNANQPLGNLQITTPTFIQFAPHNELFYFDGQNYHYTQDYAIYSLWGSPHILTPQTSAYNTSLPASSDALSNWVLDSDTNHYYLIDSGRKIDITGNRTTWFTGTFESLTDQALSGLTATVEQTNISTPSGIYIVQNGVKRYVPTYDDYLALGISPNNTLNLSAAGASKITTGTTILKDGVLFTVSGTNNVYVTNGSASYYVPTSEMLNDFGFNWNTLHPNIDSTTFSTSYPSSGTLTRWVKVNGGGLSYVTNKLLLTISPTVAANWGINLNSSGASTVSSAVTSNTSTQALGKFVTDKTTNKVYYGNNGTYQYIASYNTYVSLGGLKEPLISVSPDFFTGLTQGATLN